LIGGKYFIDDFCDLLYSVQHTWFSCGSTYLFALNGYGFLASADMQSHALSNASITPFCGIAQSTTSKVVLDAFHPSQFRLVTSFVHVSALV